DSQCGEAEVILPAHPRQVRIDQRRTDVHRRRLRVFEMGLDCVQHFTKPRAARFKIQAREVVVVKEPAGDLWRSERRRQWLVVVEGSQVIHRVVDRTETRLYQAPIANQALQQRWLTRRQEFRERQRIWTAAFDD